MAFCGLRFLEELPTRPKQKGEEINVRAYFNRALAGAKPGLECLVTWSANATEDGVRSTSYGVSLSNFVESMGHVRELLVPGSGSLSSPMRSLRAWIA